MCHEYVAETILGYLRIIARAKPGVKTGRGLEPLHQLRVTFRRLRNAFWVFKQFIPEARRRRWIRGLKVSSQNCGEARDLDIQILFLKTYRRALNDPAPPIVLDALIKKLQAKRSALQQRLCRSLAQLDQRKTLSEIRAFLRGPELARQSDRPLAKTAQKKISRRLRQVLAFGKFVHQPDKIAELHQMRIAAKCLRYTLEVFRPFYGKKMDRYIAAAIVLQRALGTMHDFDVWQLMLPGFLPKGRPLEGKKETIEQLGVYCRRERDAAYLKMVTAWESQKKTGLWDRLETLT